ncbi:MAG TPA: T9SS type A sorting domain-containing protein, partial [Saprospiraceae bacterium]|nr:T9SS type A sorting domain-containing protein [Saprospiraceae bacterium]
IRSICSNNVETRGATFFLDFRDAMFDCPPPTDLVIETAGPEIAAFRWQGNSAADRYQVNYTPRNGLLQTSDTPVPSFVQALQPADVHTFEIRTICIQPGIASSVEVFSPAYRFSIVTVDDIKAFRLSCPELETIVDTAYVIQCTEHGDFGPDKDNFLFVHKPFCQPNATRSNTSVEQLLLSPNPVQHELYISYRLREPDWLGGDLLTAQGTIAQQWLPTQWHEVGDYRQVIATQDLPPGIYFLRLHNAYRILTQKVIKLP